MDATKQTRQRRRLLRDERGSILVEFALIGPIFLALMLGIMESGIMLFAQVELDGAARAAARQIRTGQVQATGNPQQAFQAALCAGLTTVTSCASVISDVQTFGTFAAITAPALFDAQGKPIAGAPKFVPGSAGSIVAVTVIYNRKFITPWLGNMIGLFPGGLSGDAGGWNSTFIQSTVVFLNEPA